MVPDIPLRRVENKIWGDGGYFQQNLAKLAPIVCFTIPTFPHPGAILWNLGAYWLLAPRYFGPCLYAIDHNFQKQRPISVKAQVSDINNMRFQLMKILGMELSNVISMICPLFSGTPCTKL
jgi:hypothetical protein